MRHYPAAELAFPYSSARLKMRLLTEMAGGCLYRKLKHASNRLERYRLVHAGKRRAPLAHEEGDVSACCLKPAFLCQTASAVQHRNGDQGNGLCAQRVQVGVDTQPVELEERHGPGTEYARFL